MTAPVKIAAVRFIAVFMCLLFVSCAPAIKPATGRDLGLKLDPLHIEVDPKGELPPRFWDSYTLLHQGTDLFKGKKYAEALAVFTKLAQEYPQSDLYPLALFNQATCLENLGRFEEALELYRDLEARRGPSIELKEIRFRQAFCLEQMQRWDDAVVVLTRLKEMFTLTQLEHINTDIRLGVALYKKGDPAGAKDALYEGLSQYRKLEEKQLVVDSSVVAQGYFTLGEIFFERYEAAPLTGEGEELAQSLETKADLFIMARAQYIRCLETYQGQWMTAGLYRLGYGYELFYFTLKDYPAPGGLTEEQKTEYSQKLGEKLSNVLRKAIDAHERNVKLDMDFSLHSNWAEKSRQRLASLKAHEKENVF